jgi:DNA-directed RNA polymerase specialized sigma24 family protein
MSTIQNVTPVEFRKPVAIPTRGSAFCPPPAETDALVERMVLGDGVASDELKRRFGKRLVAIATEILGGEEEAEHVVNRVFEEASVGWPPERGQVARWLTRLVRRASRLRRGQLGFDA